MCLCCANIATSTSRRDATTPHVPEPHGVSSTPSLPPGGSLKTIPCELPPHDQTSALARRASAEVDISAAVIGWVNSEQVGKQRLAGGGGGGGGGGSREERPPLLIPPVLMG